MIVNYLEDSNRSHLIRVDPTIRFNWNRVMIGTENQAVRMNKIDGIMPDAISMKLMTPVRWEGRHHRQGPSFSKHCEAGHDRPRHAGAVCSMENIG